MRIHIYIQLSEIQKNVFKLISFLRNVLHAPQIAFCLSPMQFSHPPANVYILARNIFLSTIFLHSSLQFYK